MNDGVFNSIDSAVLNFNGDGLSLLNIVLALVMFGVSLNLEIDDFKKLIKQPHAFFAGVLAQFILLPAITFLVLLLIRPQPSSIALGMILIAACPGGNISNFISHLAKGDSALSVGLTGFATIVAVVMTPLNFYIYARLYGAVGNLSLDISIDFGRMFFIVFLIIGAPLFLGMWIKKKFSYAVTRILKPMQIFSIIVFLLFVVIAFINNHEYFMKDYIIAIIVLVAIHNVVALFTGYVTGRAFKLSLKRLKSITIETGIQNSGLGLILVFNFFSGLGGMAIVTAWWGIWHIISGLLLAFFWSKKTEDYSVNHLKGEYNHG